MIKLFTFKTIFALVSMSLIFACSSVFQKNTEREISSVLDNELPDKVVIKTPTQSFNRLFYFAIKDGKIWFKSNEERTGIKEEWKLFGGHGLPFDPNKKDFVVPKKIIQISADADEISALSDTYRHYFLRWDKGKMPNKVWFDVYGWPTEEPLIWDSRVKNNIVWGIGRRHKEVLWHDDIDGNPHHFGTMGITSVYFLAQNGSEIYFTDSGLPMDFSHSTVTPGRGSFVAENMSVSASTMMLINNTGEIYTRLYDFDTVGSDSVLFKYSYKREKRNDDGNKWASNFTNWSLPHEEWARHEPIRLHGLAKITKQITILQNGHGNKAREMRVLGLNESGETGYYFKQLLDKEWRFNRANIAINEKDFLDPGIHQNRQAEKVNKTRDHNYFGEFKKAKVKLHDFNIYDSPSTLEFQLPSGKSVNVTLHTVESWTYKKRFDPGFDGTPKIFYGTLILDEKGYDPNDVDVSKFINKYILPFNMKTFEMIVQATIDYVAIESKGINLTEKLQLALAREGLDYNRVPILKAELFDQNGYTLIANAPDLQFSKNINLAEKTDIADLRNKIELNKQTLALIENYFEKKNDEIDDIKLKANAFSFANVILRVTGIALLPKVKTISKHGDSILHSFAAGKKEILFYSEKDFENAKNIFKLRIMAYEKAVKNLNSSSDKLITYFDDFRKYFEYLKFTKESSPFIDNNFCASRGFIQASDEPIKQGNRYFSLKLICGGITELSFRVTPLNLENVLLYKHDKPISKRNPVKVKATVSLEFLNNSEIARFMFGKIFKSKKDIKHEEIESELMFTDEKTFLYDTAGFDGNQIRFSW